MGKPAKGEGKGDIRGKGGVDRKEVRDQLNGTGQVEGAGGKERAIGVRQEEKVRGKEARLIFVVKMLYFYNIFYRVRLTLNKVITTVLSQLTYKTLLLTANIIIVNIYKHEKRLY